MSITVDPSNTGDAFERAGGQEEVQKTLDAQAALDAERQGEPLILGKYKTQADLENAYKNLEAEYSRLKNGQQQQQPSQQQETQPSQSEPAPVQAKADTTPADPGPAPEAVAALHQSIIADVGGEDRYARLSDWVGRNVDPNRIQAYNAALESADKESASMMLKAFQFDFLNANGYEPRLAGGSFSNSNVTPFQSEQQVVAAMSDPRYSGPSADPAYVAEVEARLEVSKVFNSR